METSVEICGNSPFTPGERGKSHEDVPVEALPLAYCSEEGSTAPGLGRVYKSRSSAAITVRMIYVE